mmetsp:Transcript_3102/g.7891  ORF Transcript_3102/g.7891 Transcript_3102/m.7891 type:complete len:232 (+) Transcript_3102:373-1068(+)
MDMRMPCSRHRERMSERRASSATRPVGDATGCWASAVCGVLSTAIWRGTAPPVAPPVGRFALGLEPELSAARLLQLAETLLKREPPMVGGRTIPFRREVEASMATTVSSSLMEVELPPPLLDPGADSLPLGLRYERSDSLLDSTLLSLMTGMDATGCSGGGAMGVGRREGSTRASQAESITSSSVARSAVLGVSMDWMSSLASTEMSHHAALEKSRYWVCMWRPRESSKGR